MSRCESPQDLRDALPEPLVRMFPTLSVLPRIRPEGWVIQENPELFDEFQNVVNLVLHYQVNHLIY